jgi:hypothetical protein
MAARNTPEEFAKFQKSEVEKWEDLAKPLALSAQ